MLFPEYADAVTSVQALRDENFALRTQREQLTEQLAVAQERLVADRTRMIDYLAKRGMTDPVFDTSMVPGLPAPAKQEKTPVSARKLLRVVTPQQLREERKRMSSVGVLDDAD